MPRAYQWADGSAYVNHVELVRRARGAQMPKTFWTDPLMYQGGSDDFIAPHDDIVAGDESWGIDLEGELAVITDDVPMATSRAEAGAHIKLMMLVNDVSLRGLIPGELDKGFGFFQSKPASAFSPVAVTPDELGDAWDGGRVHLPLLAFVNGAAFGRPNAGVDMVFDFCDLIAHASRTRNLCAGTIIGSGTVSNRQDIERGTQPRGWRSRLHLHRGDSHHRDDSRRRGGNAVPALRRFRAPRDARRARPFDLRFDLATRRGSGEEGRWAVIHVDPSPEERARGVLSEANRERLLDAMRRDGVLVLDQIVDHAPLDALKIRMDRDSVDLLAFCESVGGNPRDRGHLQQGPPPVAPYVFAGYVANPLICDALVTILGDGAYCEFYNGNTNCPDSTYQQLHLDAMHAPSVTGVAGPTSAVVVNVVPQDVDEHNGAVELWPGTHAIVVPTPVPDDAIEARRAEAGAGARRVQ